MMAGSDRESALLEDDVQGLRLKKEEQDTDIQEIPNATSAVKRENASPGSQRDATPADLTSKKKSRSPIKMESAVQSPAVLSEQTNVGGDVTIKQESGKPLKLSRSASHKVERRPPPLFLDWKDKTDEATSTFDILTSCTYANKYLGTTDAALECDCHEEWGKLHAPIMGIMV